MSTKNREVHLVKRPEGLPQETDFKLVDANLPDIAEGQVLIKQLYMQLQWTQWGSDQKLPEA